MAGLKDIVFDCAHPASLARFWAAALDGYAVAPYDQAELERLRAMGIDDPEDDPGVVVEPTDGSGRPRLYFQRVPEPRTVKNRVHVDVVVDDVDVEVDRLVHLGARVMARFDDEAGDGHVTLADPEGNEFCVYP